MPRLLLSLISICLFISISPFSFGQDSLAIRDWKVSTKKISDGLYELSFTAQATNGWQLYAPNQVILESPSTELRFVDSSFVQEGEFVLSAQPRNVTSPIFEGITIPVFEGPASWKARIRINGSVPERIQGTLLYTYGRNDEFYPSTPFDFTAALEGGVQSVSRILIPSIDIEHPVANCGDTITKDSSFVTIFLLGFLGGLIALFTPCVFPMIPLTVSFFTNKQRAKTKGVGNAMLYGFFIFLIYVLLTIPFHIAGKTNPDIFFHSPAIHTGPSSKVYQYRLISFFCTLDC